MDKQPKYYSNQLAHQSDSWDLKAALETKENITVIDARSPEGSARPHVPGAINISHRTLSAETTQHIDKNALVVTDCDKIGCHVSTRGALSMFKLGFRVKELIGGLDW
jgi:rhodanese-related sulfurtransferase